MPFLHGIAAVVALLASMLATPVNAHEPERRFALVIGNSEYRSGRQPTAANDAGLIAEALRTAGFDVAGARDLDKDTLSRSIDEFLDKVTAAGPQTVSVVYVAGYGLQLAGESYFIPIDVTLQRDEDIPIEAIGISNLARSLAATPGSAKLLIADVARQHPFTPVGSPLASGLALIEPDRGALVAFNAAPGSIALIEKSPYGVFAQSLAEMIQTGDLGLDDLFVRLRLRVNERTNGISVPWYASKIAEPFLFMERTSDAPPVPPVASAMQLQKQPIREFRSDQEAYVAALERDTLGGYEEFVAAFSDSPLAPRVHALVAVRREAITWRHTLAIGKPEAYWSYLRRYPQGPHSPDAKRRLAQLAAAPDPPADFATIAYDISPPPHDEVVYLTQPAIVFDGPGFAPPPSIPVSLLPPPPPEFVVLAPPPQAIGPFFLPAPVISYSSNMPWVRPPAFVQSPPGPPMQQITINNKTITNRAPRGVGAPFSAALPSAVVTAVNSGALQPPPPAPLAAEPIQGVTLAGTGALGKLTIPLSASSRTGLPRTAPSAPPASKAAAMGPSNVPTTETTTDEPLAGSISSNRAAPIAANTATNMPLAGQISLTRLRPNRSTMASRTPSPPLAGLVSPPSRRTDLTTNAAAKPTIGSGATTTPTTASRSPRPAQHINVPVALSVQAPQIVNRSPAPSHVATKASKSAVKKCVVENGKQFCR